jgi:hypothetical protein
VWRAASAPQAECRACGVEKKHTGRDDLLAFLQPFTNLDAVGELHSHAHRSWLESIRHGDEHVLLSSGIDDGIAWNGDDVLAGHLERRGAV